MSLENAPDDVKLAVDLIVLLEENQIPARTVLRALDIVKPRFYVSTSKSIIKALINMHSFEIQLSPIG